MSQPGWLYPIVTRPILFACGLSAMMFATTFLAAQSEKVLHSFENNGTDAGGVDSALIFGRTGNLYGTSAAGGSYNVGTVFELVPTVSGEWTEKFCITFTAHLGGKGTTDKILREASPLTAAGTFMAQPSSAAANCLAQSMN